MTRPSRRSLSPRALSPRALYLGGMALPLAFFGALANTTVIVYYVRSGHLNPLQLVALGTVVEAVYFAVQLPTGVLADLVSRRLCVVLGWVLLGLGFAEQAFSAAFGNLVVAQVLIGVGAALQTGAQEAWVADRLEPEQLTPVYVRAAQLGLVGQMVGAVASGLLSDLRPALPTLVGGTGVVAIGLALAPLLADGRHPAEAGPPPASAPGGPGGPGGRAVTAEAWTLFTRQLREARLAVLAVPGLALLFAMTFFTGMWGESFDRLWSAFLLHDFRFPGLLGLRPADWLSVLAVAVALLGLGATELAKRRIDRLGHAAVAGTLLAVTALVAVGALVLASAHGFALAVAAYLLVQVVRPVSYPLISGWVASRVDSRVRATALSAHDLFDSGGQILGGPVVGWVGLAVSVRAALYAGAIALAPALGLLAAATRRVPAAPDADPDPDPGSGSGSGPDSGAAISTLGSLPVSGSVPATADDLA